MTFVSIIRFFNYCGIDAQEPSLLQFSRIKKQIAAEYSLAPDGIITIDGFVYNKQDVFDIIDSPQSVDIIQFHQIVEQHPALLHFLEKGEPSVEIEAIVEHLKDNEAFIRYLSPFFAPQFNREMKNRLQAFQFEAAADWIPNCRFVLTTDGEQAFQSTSNFLDDALRLFRNLNQNTFLSRKEEVKPWTGEWARFINWLPDMLYAKKEELGIQLINFCVEIQHADAKICYLISKQMVQLNYLDTRNTELIYDNHQVYESKVINTELIPDDRKKHFKKEKSKGGNYVWFFIAAIIFMVRMISTCNDNKPSKSNYNSNDLLVQVEQTIIKSSITQSRIDTSKMKSAKLPSIIIDSSKIMYLAFLNERDLSAGEQTLRLKNNTKNNYGIYVIHETETFDFLWEADSIITFQINPGKNFDMLIMPQKLKLVGSEIKDPQLFSKHYFTKPKTTAYSLSFNDDAILHINSDKALKPMDIELSVQLGHLMLNAKELKYFTIDALPVAIPVSSGSLNLK